MQKFCSVLLLFALVATHEALPQSKWSRPIRNSQGQLIRERRQFPFGEWIPLKQACPTCRQFADSLDGGLRSENIGLRPPRPPTVTRQIHSEGNFFPQDESAILSVPPPPPSAIPRQPSGNTNGNFQNVQFSGFSQQFNNPLPTQQIFPQTQQIQFLPQTFLSNQQVLVSNNQQVLPVVTNQNALFGQENQGKQQITNGKVPKFNSEFKTQKLTENIVLEQNKRPVIQQSSSQFSNKPTPFTLPQHQQQQAFGIQQQQAFGIQHQQQNFGGQQQQQSFSGQQQKQQQSVNFGDSILTPPPAPNNSSQSIVIPGLDKEEIQLLYVPVETLRQRGTFQEQLLTQDPQKIQFQNRPNQASSIRPTVQTTTNLPKGHFVTHSENQAQSLSSLKVTSSQPFPSTVTPSSLLVQQLPFKQTPQPFVSATPATPTIQPFVTSSPASQKFTSFPPETTLSHLVTIPNTIQFSQSDLEFGTTPKSILNQEAFQNQIISGKSQFSNFKDSAFNIQQQQRPLQPQSFVTQQPQGERQTQKSTVFLQEQQKEFEIQNQIANQQLINQQQLALQKQQEQQRLLQQQKEKELQEQYLLKQRQQKELEAERLLQQQKQKELEEQRYLQQQRQKELEEQQRLQQKRQKELEEQQFLQQQRQKELEQARFLQLQKEKELENQRRLQLQRQKELEEKRRLQQIKQKEEEQRLLRIQQQQKEQEEQRLLRIQQQQKEQEEQRLLRIQQQQKEQEEQRLLRIQQQKQKELEEQRLIRFQQQQKELEEQRLLRQRQEEEQRLLRQRQQEQELLQQRQKQEKLNNQQQIPFYQQQPLQQFPQQPTRHTLPVNDKLNSISQLAKESELDQQLVPHQPPLSVFYKGADARIVDVLKELRSSRTVTVLDQYFEKMPKVFVGPAGLIPPAGYERFELPYLSNLETNRIERKIDRLPFFVAPLNFVPPPGYAKIPFPAPHVGSVVVSSETNPAMKTVEKEHHAGSVEENGSGSYPVVGSELPGLINSLETETTTLKPVTFSSTPSLPQTTAQLRNRKPNNNLYRTQSRKPISKTRPQTTVRPEEVTQPIQKAEISKESEGGLRKPFNRFLNRRRQQSRTTTTTTTTETTVRNQQDGKNFENRHYSVDLYNQQQNVNQFPVQQQKSEFYQGQKLNNRFQFDAGSIDRTTPNGHAAFEVSPTPDFHAPQPTGVAAESDENRSGVSEYSDINLQTFEDGPLPTGSAKTITQELYRPNAIKITEQQRFSDISSKIQPKQESSEKYQHTSFGNQGTAQFGGISDVNPTSAFVSSTAQAGSHSDEVANVVPTPNSGYQNQEVPQVNAENYYSTELPRTENPFTSGSVSTPSGQQQTVGFGTSDDQFTSVFAEISKHQHFPTSTESSNREHSKFSSQDVQPTSQISYDLQAPYSTELSQEQHSQEFITSGNEKQTQNLEYSNNKFLPTGTSNEQYLTAYEAASKNQEGPEVAPTVSVNPTVSGVSQEQYTTGFLQNSNAQEGTKISEEERLPSFISYQGFTNSQDSSANSQPQYYPSSTESQSQEFGSITENLKNVEQPQIVEQSYQSVTPETVVSVTENSPQTYREETASEDSAHINDQTLTTEGQGQNFGDNLSNSHRLKLPNPSIVRVRTRVRGKPRGQVNFAASQSTTPAPIIRSRGENRYNEKTEQEYSTKASVVRDFQPIKTSKYNQYRGLKKPIRTTTTTEATTEYEQKANIYTIRPPRRPSSPSTVSTKRIRRPTTPVSTVESATESFGISTPGAYSRPEDSEFPPSGVSNDVYYEHTSLSPIRQKFRKHFGSLEQKSDVVPVYSSTAFPSTEQYYPTATQEEYSSEELNGGKDLVVSVSQDNPEVYPEWNPSESGIDVSGIVLTTVRTPVYEEQQEEEEPKKALDNKKAFDPDLEKKSGRRRVRVRVHKRPHENFETAESQNLRTVANVLVPPTSTYKPVDDTNIHQLAKNSDFSFGGQKLFGARSREYFRKRLNITRTGDSKQGEAAKEEEQSAPSATGVEGLEKVTGTKVLTYVKKIHRGQNNEYDSSTAPSAEGNAEDGKIFRTKHRGYVRKIIKHKGVSKDVDSQLNQETENENHEEKNIESQERHPFRVNHEGAGQNGRLNGTRHRTFVRYVKKNKLRPHSTEVHQETTSEETQQKEEQGIHHTPEYVTETSSQEQQTQGVQLSQEKQITESGVSHQQQTTQSEAEEQQITQSGSQEQQITQSGSQEQQITQSGSQEQQLTQSGAQEQQVTESHEQQEEKEDKTEEQGQKQISGFGILYRQRQQGTHSRGEQQQVTDSGAQEQEQITESEVQQQQEAVSKTPERQQPQKITGLGFFQRQRQQQQQQLAQSGGQQQITESGAQEQQLSGFGLLHRQRQHQITQSRILKQQQKIGSEVLQQQQINESETSQQPTQESELNTSQQSTVEQSKSGEYSQGLYPVYEKTQQSQTLPTEEEESQQTQRSDVLRTKQSELQQTEQPEVKQIQQSEIQASENSEDEKALDDVTITDEYKEIEDAILHEVQTSSTSSLPTQKPKFFRTGFQRPPYTGFQRSKESLSHFSTTERAQEVQEKRDGQFRPKYGKTSGFGAAGSGKYEEVRKANEFKSEQQLKNKNQHTLEVRKYIRTKTREGAFSQFTKNRYYTSEKTETVATTENHDEVGKEVEEYSTPVEKTTSTKIETVRVESPATESRFHTTQYIAGITDPTNEQTETTKTDEDSDLHLTTTETIENSTEEESSEEESDEEDKTDVSTTVTETATEVKTEAPTTHRTFKYKVVESSSERRTEVPTTYQTPKYEAAETTPETKTEGSPTIHTSRSDSVENFTETKTEVPATFHTSSSEETENLTEGKTVGETATERAETHYTDTQPDLYRFSKSSFSFDEAGKFTGIKNRAHVRNITANIIESTASFSAPGVEKRVVSPTSENSVSQQETFRVEVTRNDKTDDTTTEYNTVEPTTEYPEGTQTEPTTAADLVTKAKIAKLIKTSTTTKISHETEICYKGKCIRTKAENPDEDLKLLVDTANIMKIEKPKT